jgi:predicted oxidoreductase
LTYDVTEEMIEEAFAAARQDGRAVGVPKTTPLSMSIYKKRVPTTLLLNTVFERGGWAKVR